MHGKRLWSNCTSWLVAGLGVVQTAQAQVVPPPQPSATAPLVFRGATVIDVRTGKRLPKRTVVIVGNRIQAIAPANDVRVPKAARVVDARGKYLIPGLWDLHVHPRNYIDIAFPLLLANGVTGVRDAGSEVPLDTLVRWKREIASGARIGPRYLVSGPALTEAKPGQSAVTVDDPRPGFAMYLSVPLGAISRVVDSLKAAGADFIKTYYMSSRAAYLLTVAAARRAGLLYGGHLPNEGSDGKVYGPEASDSGATFLDHEPYLDNAICGAGDGDTPFNMARCHAAAEQLRRNNTWVTLGFFGLAARPTGHARIARYLPASFTNAPRFAALAAKASAGTVRDPNSTAEWAALLHYKGKGAWARWVAAGLPIVVGSDMSFVDNGLYDAMTPGFIVHELLLAFVLEGGMTPLEALRTVTLNPALALRATDSLGTVETGKLADLLLLDADPLTDIWNTNRIQAVVANGRYYNRAALDSLLAEAAQAAKRR